MLCDLHCAEGVICTFPWIKYKLYGPNCSFHSYFDLEKKKRRNKINNKHHHCTIFNLSQNYPFIRVVTCHYQYGYFCLVAVPLTFTSTSEEESGCGKRMPGLRMESCDSAKCFVVMPVMTIHWHL